MKRIILLGATGSIGTQTIDVCLAHPSMFEIVGLSVGKNIKLLRDILKNVNVKHVCVASEEDYMNLKSEYSNITFHFGKKGLEEIVTLPNANLVVNALDGFAGLTPTLKAIEAKKDIALANKESLVVAGEFVLKALKEHNVTLLPIDSEHSAIFQCLQGNTIKEVKRLIVTASGGSFRDKTRNELLNVTKKDALNHPNWSMGEKITINSATMMNKGLEVIEAHYLFNLDYDKIDVVLHKESIIHSMVEYCDHSIIAQLSTADMRMPIQYALSYPSRINLLNSDRLDLLKVGSLHFREVDFNRYPLVKLAYEVGRKKGNMPVVMNGANEACLDLFLNDKIPFIRIDELVIKAVDAIEYKKEITLEDVYLYDQLARNFVYDLVEGEMKCL